MYIIERLMRCVISSLEYIYVHTYIQRGYHICFPLLVDDSTGCIRCVWWHNEGPPPSDVQQGSLVTVIGKINEYKDTKQIFISKIGKAFNRYEFVNLSY